jgi:hypothetical protein
VIETHEHAGEFKSGGGHKVQKVRVTGYLLWDDEHNGSPDVGSTIEYLSKNGFHHPWRSTAWEIHPVMKIQAIRN